MFVGPLTKDVKGAPASRWDSLSRLGVGVSGGMA